VKESRRPLAPARNAGEFDVSVVIPLGAGDEGVGRLLTAVRALMRQCRGRSEVVLVDDGMPHGFESIATRWRTHFEGLSLARHDARKGRGAAARTGMLSARGNVVVVIDPDLEVSLEHGAQLVDSLRRGADVALVSRRPQEDPTDGKTFLERAAETTVMRLSQLMVPVGVRDCFSGLIALRSRAAKRIAQRSRVSGPAYPVEWLALSQYLGFQVVEFPLHWVRPPAIGDRSRRKGSAFELLRDVWATRKRLAQDDYDHGLDAQELLGETSFRKMDRRSVGVEKR
jgi:dolichyl-phosphate beta-glucosyltransferase